MNKNNKPLINGCPFNYRGKMCEGVNKESSKYSNNFIADFPNWFNDYCIYCISYKKEGDSDRSNSYQ